MKRRSCLDVIDLTSDEPDESVDSSQDTTKKPVRKRRFDDDGSGLGAASTGHKTTPDTSNDHKLALKLERKWSSQFPANSYTGSDLGLGASLHPQAKQQKPVCGDAKAEKDASGGGDGGGGSCWSGGHGDGAACAARGKKVGTLNPYPQP